MKTRLAVLSTTAAVLAAVAIVTFQDRLALPSPAVKTPVLDGLQPESTMKSASPPAPLVIPDVHQREAADSRALLQSSQVAELRDDLEGLRTKVRDYEYRIDALERKNRSLEADVRMLQLSQH